MHVLMAMSGGVDSSVAAALLLEQGHRVTGVFLRNGVHAGQAASRGKQGCCSVGDAADARRVADRLGIPFYALDFAAEFDSIVDEFVREYARGRTPNPCVSCNRDLKFGELLDFADTLGADAIATGHYARLLEREGRTALGIPRDLAKDQTYVLFPLGQDVLRRSLFPLAELTKAEVRARAEALGLAVSGKPESMEICFVPTGDYRDVLRERAPDTLLPGPIVDGRTGAEIGRHGGVATLTLGQRRGLRLAADRPLYVTDLDAETGVVTVGPREDLLRDDIRVERWNAVGAELPTAGSHVRATVRVRRNDSGTPGRLGVERRDDGTPYVRVVLDRAVQAPAPGQALVAYDDEGLVLGGGYIASSART